MRNFKTTLLLIAITASTLSIVARAQNTNNTEITTGIGFMNVYGELGEVLKPALSFNSGLVLNLKKNWFMEGKITFNTLIYDQKYRDNASKYLFTNTNSSMLQLGIIGGKDFPILKQNLLIGLYTGLGYLNIGEPRLTVDVINSTVRQEAMRNGNIYGSLGSRVTLITKSPFLRTIFIDGSYFASPQRIQQNKLNGFSLFLGTRFMMK